MGGLGERFSTERPRLLRIAARILADADEAEDVVQQAWLRLQRAGDDDVENLPAWLTTVTTRLCLDRLRARLPVPDDDVARDDAHDDVARGSGAPDPADEVALADTVGVALQVVLDRLSPRERVAFVLHDSFGFEFPTIAAVLDTTPTAARKLASRARAKVRQPASEDSSADAAVVDAFMAAARGGDLDRLIRLLAPGAEVNADDAAIAAGTPARIEGRADVAGFFDGAAHAALPVHLDGRPGFAWFHRGEAQVLFDFDVADGVVERITFRADPAVLARLARRVTPARRPSSSEGEPSEDEGTR